jgi:hypothetical protein
VVLRLAGVRPANARRLADAARARQRAKLLADRLQRHEDRARQRRHERLERFLAEAIWPSTTRHDCTPQRFQAMRFVQQRENAGSFHSDKLGRAVEYESGLELAFLQRLEDHPSVTSYQEQPVEIEYTLADARHLYVPDVIVIFDDGRGLLVEIKAPLEMAVARNVRKWAAAARWCGHTGVGLLIGDGQKSLSDVLLTELDENLCDRMLCALRGGPISYPRYRALAGTDRSVNALAALVAGGHVSWDLNPFTLRLPSTPEAQDARALTALLRQYHRAAAR